MAAIVVRTSQDPVRRVVGEVFEAEPIELDDDVDLDRARLLVVDVDDVDLDELPSRLPLPTLVLMSDDAQHAVVAELMARGARDVIRAPFSDVELANRLRRLDGPKPRLIGSSRVVQKLREVVLQVAPVDTTVLITGQTGVGKELIARMLHAESARAGEAFVAVNCAAIPETLLEAELFGREKGAYTGAVQSRAGRFVTANEGTLFLDEIGELPCALQAKLLRALQERVVEPVGSAEPIPIDVRVIAATNRNLHEEVQSGAFRADLYYRLNVVPIHVPPLTERREDIPILVGYFLMQCNERFGHNTGLPDETCMKRFMRYDWPGNVRELAHLIERLVVLTPDRPVDAARLAAAWTTPQPEPQDPDLLFALPDQGIDLPEMLRKYERAMIRAALEKAEGNKRRAASLLGLNRTTLVEKVKRLEAEDDADEGDETRGGPS